MSALGTRRKLAFENLALGCSCPRPGAIGTGRATGDRQSPLKLGIEISQAAVSKYMVRHRKPPSPLWRAFLNNHVKDLGSTVSLAKSLRGAPDHGKVVAIPMVGGLHHRYRRPAA